MINLKYLLIFSLISLISLTDYVFKEKISTKENYLKQIQHYSLNLLNHNLMISKGSENNVELYNSLLNQFNKKNVNLVNLSINKKLMLINGL